MARKQNFKAPPLKPTNEEEASFCKKLVAQNLTEIAIYQDRPRVTIDDLDEIKRRTESYLQRCIDFERYPTVTGLSVGIGIDRKTFYSWLSGKPSHPTSKYLKEIQTVMAENLEQASLCNKVNPVTSIFLLKATHGYREATETIVTHQSALGELKTEAEIEADIDNDVIEDDVIDVEFEEKS